MIELAREFAAAYAARQPIAVPPSARDGGLDLNTAYAIAAELVEMRRSQGHVMVGRKIGIANKAMWRALGLETLVWGAMYEDTVWHTGTNEGSISVAGMWSPKIEPEIVFKMRKPLGPGAEGAVDAATALDAVEWMALGFEIIDCPFPDWKFKPADFVASYGFHAGLVVGQPVHLDASMIPALCDHLAVFKVTLAKDGVVVAEGSGKNVLRSPALCLAELAAAAARQPGAEALGANEIVSSGTLTESQRIGPGETWTTRVEGLELPPLKLRT